MADDPGSQGFPSPKGAVRCQIQPIRPGMRTWPHAAVRAWPKPTSQGRGGCPLGLARSAEVVLCHEKEPRGGAREAATARLVAGRGQPVVAAAEGGATSPGDLGAHEDEARGVHSVAGPRHSDIATAVPGCNHGRAGYHRPLDF